MTVTSGSMNLTVPLSYSTTGPFSCRCGEVHAGDYALADYMHHECFHAEPLLLILHGLSSFKDGLLMCGQCGESFAFEVIDG